MQSYTPNQRARGIELIMIYLIAVSLIWALSFGLIKTQLTNLDPNFVSFARLLLSFLVFLPFLKIKNITTPIKFKLMGLGMIQFGIMYITYIHAYQFLKAYQIALFTIFTPFFVTLINDVITKKFHLLFFFSATLAILGTGIIVYQDISLTDLQWGFVLVQISNLCFAFGQIYYKNLHKQLSDLPDKNFFALIYLGAVLLTGVWSSITTPWSLLVLTTSQIFTLVYLGIMASGLCFFLWNLGATKVNAGTLAILNNLKIPLAILAAVLLFHETCHPLKLMAGMGLLLIALFLNEKFSLGDRCQ